MIVLIFLIELLLPFGEPTFTNRLSDLFHKIDVKVEIMNRGQPET